jgi:hypothetical protein
MLGAYMESSHLRAWGDRAQFVLASLTQTNSGSERCQKPLLWAVGAQDLTDFTDRQGKGTVNHEGLDELITLGCAKPLESLLEDVAYRGQLVDSNYSPPRRESGFGDSLWFHPLNLSAPSPLGLALVL